jgi:hypothetical protein
MENLACIVFVFAVYSLWAIAAYQPNPAAAKPIAKPVTVTQALPAAAYVAPKPANTNGDRLESMTIRQLYALAAAKGIKRYKSKSKAALLVELSK